MFRNCTHNNGTRTLHALGADDDQSGFVLAGHVKQHVRHGALADFGVTVNAFLHQFAGQLVQHFAGLFREALAHFAGNGVDGRVLQRVKPVRQNDPRAIICGQLAGILQSGFRLAVQVSGHHNGFKPRFETHIASRRRGTSCCFNPIEL